MTEAPDFGALAGAFIDTANDQAKTHDRRLVGAALLHAAARYNAFVSVTTVETQTERDAMRQEHIDFYVQQFRDALEHHYTEQAKHLNA